jgi:hypothetical protein
MNISIQGSIINSDNIVSESPPGGEGITLTIAPRVMEPGVTEPPVDNKVLSSKRAHGLLRGLLLILQHHDAPKAVLDSFQTQAMAYLDVESEAIFFKRAKFLTLAPMARYLKCEAPKSPDVAFQASGHWKRWSHSRLNVFNRRNTHLWYSLLQGKRCALPASDALVLTTYEDHREAMNLDDPIDAETFQLVMKELEPILKRIQNRLVGLYDTNRYLETDEEDSWFVGDREVRHVASTRACFEASRDKGGQLGYIASLCPRVQSMNPSNPVSDRVLPDLKRMRYYPVAVVRGVVRYNVLIEEYDYPDGEIAWRDTIQKESVKFTGGIRCKATIQAVLEPLKVRVISKGNAVPYYISKPLQQAMHGIMREMNCFRLIGRPLCPTDLNDLEANRCILGSGRYEWFSIDYSAATDKLSASLSAAILSRIIKGQDPLLQEVWRSVLAPHTCRYPFPFSEVVKPVEQKNGQLMGSILSFPILCLANLGLYLANIAEDTRPLKDKLNGVLVNGDDMLYVAKQSMWKPHVELGNRVGLTMSPGKAYHHQTYANANSACYHLDLYNRRATPYSIPFLNVGLYFGQGKVLGGDDVSSERSLTSVIDRLVQGSRPGKQADIFRAYLSRHKHGIRRECSDGRNTRNLFIPIEMGGMGVSLIDGIDPQITSIQQREAYYHYQMSPHNWLGRGCAPGPPVKEVDVSLKAPWIAVSAEKRSRSYMRRGLGLNDMLSRANCLQGFTTCLAKRSEWENRVGVPTWNNQENFSIFEKRQVRDRMYEHADLVDSELELLRVAAIDLAATLEWLSGFE